MFAGLSTSWFICLFVLSLSLLFHSLVCLLIYQSVSICLPIVLSVHMYVFAVFSVFFCYSSSVCYDSYCKLKVADVIVLYPTSIFLKILPENYRVINKVFCFKID